MANHARAQHNRNERKARIFVGSFKQIKAYIMLPKYSKNSDQQGPLRGNIYPLPRTSRGIPGNAGIMRHEHINARKVMDNVDVVPSQRSIPVKRKDIRPIVAPITTIGWSRMRRRRKKPPNVSVFPQRSS